MSRLDELRRMRDFLDVEIETEELLGDVPTIREPITAAAFFYGVSVADLLSSSRIPLHVRARQAAAWLMRQRGMSYPEIGRVLRRDHTTVMHAVQAVERVPAVRDLIRGLLEAA